MAITRAQQAKQMLQDGGRIGFKQGQSRRGGAPGGRRAGPGTGSGGGKDRDKGSDFGQFDRAVQRAKENPGITTGGGDRSGDGSSILDFVPGIGTVRRIAGIFGPIDNREFFQQKVVPAGRTNLNFDDYMKARQAGLIDAYGNPINQDNDNNIILPQTMMAETMFQAPSNMDQEPTEEDDMDDRFLRFRAEGGPIGGIMDIESGRQMYFLGKLVKKATRAVKKIVKSPIGKAALLYAGAGGLGNLAAGKDFFTGFTSPTNFLGRSKLANIFTRQGLGNIGSSLGLGSMISEKTAGDEVVRKFAPNLLGKIFTSPAGLIATTSIAAGLLTPEQEEEAQLLATEQGIDIEAARNSILARAQGNIQDDFRARGFRAEGGRIGYQEGSKEPVAKKTMPLLDMGGQEMDLREEGGFVPIGRMEKADDVPARLSKNEFVFTADAVRNAGDGDVDKGAEVMYNMMKNLEAGGDVSEESQGKEGARRMFQTSQRLEEVL